MVSEKHMTGTINEHYHHPADGAPDICVKCATVEDFAKCQVCHNELAAISGLHVGRCCYCFGCISPKPTVDPRSPDQPAVLARIELPAIPPGSIKAVRAFETGATRDTDTGKFGYEGFLSPLVLQRFAAFMHKHRVQSDGTLRDPDNWQRGIPCNVYADSLVRHLMEFWLAHRGYGVHPRGPRDPQDVEEVLCAVMFNVMGYLFEVLKAKQEVAA